MLRVVHTAADHTCIGVTFMAFSHAVSRIFRTWKYNLATPRTTRRCCCCENMQVNLLEMSNAEVEEFLIGMGEPKFRAKQVFRVGKIEKSLTLWAYRGVLVPRPVFTT